MFLVRNDPPLTFPAFPVIPVSVHLAFRQLLQDGFSGLLLNLLLTGLLDLRLHKRFLDFCQSVLHDPLDFGYCPMPKQEGQKSKLVTLLRILEQRTDENHRLNVPQLVQLLENQGILAERKSIYSDIDTLRSLGYDIQLQRGRGGGYWMASRAFELSELKLLVDAVQSSSVISARTSKRIIHKLEALCSDYEGTQLQRQVYVDGRPKTDSQTLLYSIDALHTAINRGCLVQFRYKGSSAVRTVSPWQLAWENGCYYLIAYQDEKAPPVRHYRVDRMAGVLVLDEPVDGLDPVMRRQVWSLLLGDVADRGTTVLVSSHNLRELEDVCDHVGIMNKGRVLLERSLSELQDNTVKLQVAYAAAEEPPLPEGIRVLHRSAVGRVITYIVRGSREEVLHRMQALSPLLLEAIPLTLEEIFIYELGGADYAVRDIVL